MPVGGLLVEQGKLSFVGVVAAGTFGSTLGALPLYYLGRKIGEKRLRRFANRHGRWLAFSCDDIDKSKKWFQKHGRRAVFLCRLVPGIRSLISIPAGLDRMPLAGFLVYTALGTAIWAAVLAWLGYQLGGQVDRIGKFIDPITYAVFGLIGAIYLYRVVTHKAGEEEARCE